MADSPLRICLLTYRGNPRSGGQGIYVRLLSRELAALGHDVEIWSGPPYPELVDDPRIRLVELPSLDLWNEDALFRTPDAARAARPHQPRRVGPHADRRLCRAADLHAARRASLPASQRARRLRHRSRQSVPRHRAPRAPAHGAARHDHPPSDHPRLQARARGGAGLEPLPPLQPPALVQQLSADAGRGRTRSRSRADDLCTPRPRTSSPTSASTVRSAAW